jgi:asparagine synthase (glutamine-hydrolysing)
VTHIAMLAKTHNHLERFPAKTGFRMLCPLLSQPIVELCLRIPSWEWVAGGRDRAAVRRSFEDIVPAPILRRVSKSGPDSLYFDAFNSNKMNLREFLSDGLLAKQGLLDRSAVTSFLAAGDFSRTTDHFRLMYLADIEAWARHWSSPRPLRG